MKMSSMLWYVPVNSNHPFPPPFADVIHPEKIKRKEIIVTRGITDYYYTSGNNSSHKFVCINTHAAIWN